MGEDPRIGATPVENHKRDRVLEAPDAKCRHEVSVAERRARLRFQPRPRSRVRRPVWTVRSTGAVPPAWLRWMIYSLTASSCWRRGWRASRSQCWRIGELPRVQPWRAPAPEPLVLTYDDHAVRARSVGGGGGSIAFDADVGRVRNLGSAIRRRTPRGVAVSGGCRSSGHSHHTPPRKRRELLAELPDGSVLRPTRVRRDDHGCVAE